MYNYLQSNTLSGDDSVDRKTLLLSENYYIENDCFYKISLPRGRKQKRVRDEYTQLYVPMVHRQSLMSQYHQLLGHYSIGKLHPVMIQQYYWKNMAMDLRTFVKHCETCQASKTSNKTVTSPLFALPVPVFSTKCNGNDNTVV